ncbi:MAG: hypothetical protein FJ255_01755 [Phycisphaerae bacterium]|nr:hypothetical protein [Phycisphaerae bacterium]
MGAAPGTRGAEFGAYRYVRELGPHAVGERWLAFDPRSGTSCTVYRLVSFRGRMGGRRALRAIARISAARHAHLLPMLQVGVDGMQTPCVVTDYTGHHDGLVTLSQLVEAKGGRLPVPEAARAVGQLTEACAAAHASGLVHGRFGADDVLVDRFGQLWIELYGLTHLLRRAEGVSDAEAIADEARSVVDLGRALFLGESSGYSRRVAVRAGVPSLWSSWLSRGTGSVPPFVSVEQAHAALPNGEAPAVCRDCPATWRDWARRLARAIEG